MALPLFYLPATAYPCKETQAQHYSAGQSLVESDPLFGGRAPTAPNPLPSIRFFAHSISYRFRFWKRPSLVRKPRLPLPGLTNSLSFSADYREGS